MLRRLIVKRGKVRSIEGTKSEDNPNSSELPTAPQPHELPQIWSTPLAQDLAESITSDMDAAEIVDKIQRFGIEIRKPDVIEGSLGRFNPSPEAFLELATYVGSQRESRVRVVLLHAGCLMFPENEILWRELASVSASINEMDDAATVYSLLSKLRPDNAHYSWNAATLHAAAGNVEKAISEWETVVSDRTDAMDRTLAFAPIFLLLEGKPFDAEAKKVFNRATPLLSDQPDWIKRRAVQIVEKHFPAILFHHYSVRESATISKSLQKLGFEDSLLAGWREISVEDVEDARSLAAIGSDAARNGDSERAVAAINKLEDLTGEDDTIWIEIASIYATLGRFDDALKALKHVQPSVADLQTVIQSIPSDRFNSAMLPFLIEIWSVAPSSVEIAKVTGEIAFKHGALDTAIQAFKKVEELESLDVASAYSLGIAYLMSNQPDDARQALSLAIKENSHHRRAFYYRGHVEYQMGQFKEAIADFESALSIDPKDADTLYFLSVAQRADRQHGASARTAHQLLLDTDPKADQHHRARILFLTEAALSGEEDLIEMAVAFCKADVLKPTTGFNIKTLLMVFLANIGRVNEARSICDILTKQAPRSDIISTWNTFLNLRLGRIETLPKVTEDEFSAPALSMPDRLKAALHAKHFLDIGRWKDASSTIAQVVTIDPTYGGAAYIMGRALAMQGKASAAAPYIRRADQLQQFAEETAGVKNLVSAMSKSSERLLSKEIGDIEAYKVWAGTEQTIAPIVTVGVPAYNESRFLADALNSVWLQSMPFWQCLVVDDVSSDDTRKIADDYCNLDSRFAAVTHKKNKGLAGSRNTALASANTPYVTFLDGDDFLTANSLWRRAYILTSRFSEETCAGVYGGMRHCPENTFGELPLSEPIIDNKTVTFATAGYEAPFNAHAPLLRTDVMKKVGGFAEEMKHGAEDWECWLRILRQGYNFFASTHQCGLYRQKRGSMVRSLAPHHVAAAKEIYSSLLSKDSKRGFIFKDPFPVVDASLRYTKRSLTFASMAFLAGDEKGGTEIVSRIPLSLDQIERAGISMTHVVRQGAQRFFADTFIEVDGISRKPFIETETQRIADLITSQLEASGGSPGLFAGTDAAKASRGGRKKATEADVEETSSAATGPAYMRLEETAHRYANREKLAAMRNKHAGEKCFIIGNGPSLNDLDLTKIGNTPAIGVNGIFYKCEEVDWWPRYYTVEDSSVMKENLERIVAFPAEEKFFPSIYNRFHPHDENVNFFVMNRGFYEAKSPNFGVPRFSTDFAQRAYCGQTVTYINMQLAFHMGFTEVYLIGMDFSYVIPKEFEKQGDMIVSTGDDPNHFHKDYFGKGKSWKDPKLEMVLLNYKMAKLAYEAAGRKIYNATVGGQLELFERVDYDTIF